MCERQRGKKERVCVCVCFAESEGGTFIFSPVMSKAVKISWHLESCDGIMRTNDLRIPAVCAHKCVFTSVCLCMDGNVLP